jgi:hypothetical protein
MVRLDQIWQIVASLNFIWRGNLRIKSINYFLHFGLKTDGRGFLV